MRDEIFRPEAKAAQAENNRLSGEIVLIRPVSFTVVTAIAAFASIVIMGYFSLASYTKRIIMAGELVPDKGLVGIYPPFSAVVTAKHVEDNQSVVAGQSLFTLSARPHDGDAQSPTSIGSLRFRLHSLYAEAERTRAIHGIERKSAGEKISSLKRHIRELSKEMEASRAAVAAGISQLRDEETKRDQYSGLKALERQRDTLEQALLQQEADAMSLRLRQQNQLGQVHRQIQDVEQVLAQKEHRGDLILPATINGTVTQVSAETGDFVEPAQPIAYIVPGTSTLQARFSVRRSELEFVRAGASVLLRFMDYPRENFGLSRGVVTSISTTALPRNQTIHRNAVPATTDEATYRITVKLESGMIHVKGKEFLLRPGMAVEGEILHEPKRLFGQFFSPLLVADDQK